MEIQFLSQNAHFAINLFAAFVCLAVAWLHIDAWTNRRDKKELFKWIGFALVGLSFLCQATLVEQTVLGNSILGSSTATLIIVLRALGYIGIIISQLIDPLMEIPKIEGYNMEEEPTVPTPPAPTVTETLNEPPKPTLPQQNSALMGTVGLGIKWLLPAGALVIAALYWRRATTGLERHLKPVAYAFAFIALSDLLHLAALARDTTNPVLYSWVAAFGIAWWLEHLVLLTGVIILGIWVWGYLVKRFFSQLFMIFVATTVAIFLIVSISFTFLLLQNIRSTALTNLSTASNVLKYALQAKQIETKAGAEQLAASREIREAVAAKDHNRLAALTSSYLADKKQSGLIITNDSGMVLLRGQDPSSWGDSLSEDLIIKRALFGIDQSSTAIKESVGAPIVEVRSAATIRDDAGTIIGSVVASLNLDSAFVGGLKQTTGLESSVFADKTLSATTTVGPDGKSHALGTKVANKKVEEQVLGKGDVFLGTVEFQNKQVLAAYAPLKDVDNATIGMILAAQPESSILKTAGRSVQLTFVLTAIVLIMSVVPIYFITRSLAGQL